MRLHAYTPTRSRSNRTVVELARSAEGRRPSPKRDRTCRMYDESTHDELITTFRRMEKRARTSGSAKRGLSQVRIVVDEPDVAGGEVPHTRIDASLPPCFAGSADDFDPLALKTCG